ncbi:MAG: hypothetical protein GXX85_00800 [Ignavibacteria bacterium]|nr:hypothetical protein [Ignavibacteria bacterium]
MRIFTLFVLLSFLTVTIQAQSIRKSGSKYVSITASQLKYGNDFGLQYEQYFSKGFSYFLKTVYEKSTVELTSYNTYRLDVGSYKSISSSLDDLYLNIGIAGYLGQQFITNEYYPQEENFVYGIYLNPKIEYFIIDNLSLALGLSTYFDFNSDFRNKHYSYSLTLSYQL